MNALKTTACIGMLAIGLSGCASHSHPPVDHRGVGVRQTIGSVIGTVGGALIGTQIGAGSGKTVATIVGGLIGGMMGSAIGERRDIEAEISRGSIETTDQYDSPAPYTYSLGPDPEESYYYRSAYW